MAEIRLALRSTWYEPIIYIQYCLIVTIHQNTMLHPSCSTPLHLTFLGGRLVNVQTLGTRNHQYLPLCFHAQIAKAKCSPGIDYLAIWLSPSVNTQNLRLVRSIRLARALRGIRIVWLFEYVGALRTLALSIISISDKCRDAGGRKKDLSQQRQQKGRFHPRYFGRKRESKMGMPFCNIATWYFWFPSPPKKNESKNSRLL